MSPKLLRRKKIPPYEKNFNLDTYLSYFKEGINNLPEDKRRFELKKSTFKCVSCQAY